MTTPRARPRVSPVWLVLVGILSVQVGAGIAKDLFDEASPTVIVWLRLAFSALILVLVVRPVLRGRTREEWLVALAFGATLGIMNWSIYQAFARIPLGIAVTIEFVGPLALAVLGSRRARDLLWVGLAGAGVLLLGLDDADLELAGVLYALLAGAAWAGYILLSAQTGRRWPGFDGLTIASVVAAVLLLPLLLTDDGVGGVVDPRLLLLGALIGLMSSVVPYSLELVALRSLKPSVFGVLMSLEPAAAALVGFLVLREVLTPAQLVAIACVVVASVGATRSRATIAEPVPD